MKKFLLLLILFFCLVIGGCWAVKTCFLSKGKLVVVTIEPGASGSSVARTLKEKGIIKSQFFFKLILRLTSSARDLKAGRFDLRENTSSFEVINCIKSGKCTHYEKITVLEGWRSEEIAEALAERNITDPHAFLDIVRQKDLEGYLFPSTYLFAENTPAQKVVDEMLQQYRNHISPLFKQYKTDLTEKQVLTVASIVEREAIVHDERPKIAAVYLNRFRIGKRLEADPTVQYALGFNLRENRYWKKGLTYSDLKTKSPYNTYRNAGLPPGQFVIQARNLYWAYLTRKPALKRSTLWQTTAGGTFFPARLMSTAPISAESAANNLSLQTSPASATIPKRDTFPGERTMQKAKLLKIYVSSTDTINHVPLYEIIAKKAQEFGLEGATAHRAMLGFGPSTKLRSAHFLELVEKYPVLIEMVDEPGKIDKFAKTIEPVLNSQPKGCLMLVQDIEVLFKKHGTKAQ